VSDVCLVSACLLGIKCRYDARSVADLSRELKDAGYIPVPVCPEQFSGLPTPRECCEIAGGDGMDVIDGRARVLTQSGKDVTDYFLRGAEIALRICRIVEAEVAFLKELSPSCGVSKIYDGSFTGRIKEGCGVTAACLKRNGIAVYGLKNGQPEIEK